MAIQFILETGAGLSTATAYISLDELKQYWDNFGYDYSALTDDQLMQNINKCTQLLDSLYGSDWPGYRLTETQSLEWPREEAVYIDGIEIATDVVPPEIKNATSEYVKALLIDGVNPQPNQASTGTISKESVKVDVIEKSTTYTEYSSQSSVRTYITSVRDALSRILSTSESGRFFGVKILRV